MDTAIANLNKTIELREFMVNQILNREGNGKSNSQYERLQNKLNNLPFTTLDKKLTKIAGDWRTLYNYPIN
jgi:hypothetical protein